MGILDALFGGAQGATSVLAGTMQGKANLRAQQAAEAKAKDEAARRQQMDAMVLALQGSQIKRNEAQALPKPEVQKPNGWTVNGHMYDNEDAALGATKKFAGAGRAPKAPGTGARQGPPAQKGPPAPKVNATQQSKLAQVEPMRQSLENYASIVTNFMKLPAAVRAAAMAGLGHQDELGKVEAAQKGVLLDLKNVAQLGVLSAQDEQIVNGLIGDPTSMKALFRDPQYVLSRLNEARGYIQRKAAGLGAGTEVVGGKDIARNWQERATQLRESGMDNESVMLKLKEEGFIH